MSLVLYTYFSKEFNFKYSKTTIYNLFLLIFNKADHLFIFGFDCHALFLGYS